MFLRFTEILEGEYKGELYDWGKNKIEVLIDYQGHQPVGSLGAACIGRTENFIEMVFYRGMYSCHVRINDFCIDKADMPKYEKLVHYFSRIIAEKMPAIVIENP